ncbi:MAG: hypothetical protein IJ022_03885 [Burkholderiaceae bacterium]|nr:hypothetical protein [Burkholderiaceae bacterium]
MTWVLDRLFGSKLVAPSLERRNTEIIQNWIRFKGWDTGLVSFQIIDDPALYRDNNNPVALLRVEGDVPLAFYLEIGESSITYEMDIPEGMYRLSSRVCMGAINSGMSFYDYAHLMHKAYLKA